MEESLTMEQFDLIEKLGSGSFGEVHLVRKKTDGQQYAMKVVSFAKLTQKDKQAALNEIRLLASIDIPYVIAYKGAFYHEQEKQLCILLEYANGGDLEDLIIKHREDDTHIPEEQIWKISFEVLKGLKSLHRNHIVHRDIKSANIFFAEGTAKLGDLNVSKFIESGMCSTYIGTPYYTSPEIWKGDNYTSKCDIWSAGCVFYEMCALKAPFRAPNFVALYNKVTSGLYQEIPEVYSDPLRKLISLCLTVDEEMRPSAAELLDLNRMRLIRKQLGARTSIGTIDLMGTITCPESFELLNQILPSNIQSPPKPQEPPKKKTVNFCDKVEKIEKKHVHHKREKLCSEKIIGPSQKDSVPSFILEKKKRRLEKGDQSKNEETPKAKVSQSAIEFAIQKSKTNFKKLQSSKNIAEHKENIFPMK